jgi:acyl carrier protein phosphodiesterase
MNYLAHAYLSFEHPEILTGNMIGDFVKGQQINQYGKDIQAGIRLHRFIDTYTDSHPITIEIKQYFRKPYRLYAAPITDIILDYFVANDERNFSSKELLMDFTQRTYHTLELQSNEFPEKFSNIFPYMRKQNWLYHYHATDGIYKSLKGLERRASYMENAEKAFQLFLTHREEIFPLYNSYFTELKNAVKTQFDLLLTRK